MYRDDEATEIFVFGVSHVVLDCLNLRLVSSS